jgi:hypothetical protein
MMKRVAMGTDGDLEDGGNNIAVQLQDIVMNSDEEDDDEEEEEEENSEEDDEDEDDDDEEDEEEDEDEDEDEALFSRLEPDELSDDDGYGSF